MSKSRGLTPVCLSADDAALAQEARTFARSREYEPTAASPMRGGMDREFSRELGRRGYTGMQLPVSYGGHDRTAVARCLVVSELLAAGAPLGAHWTADRQVGPSVLRNGSDKLRALLLPRIAAGDCLVAGGLSEPEAGSDLASVRTRARRAGDHWVISGRKIWTSDADKADFIEVFCRTRELDPARRHDGLSMIIVPMTSPGISVHPIRAMDGQFHFNEVILDDVIAHDDDFVGEEGEAWAYLSAELALERAGPERFLSSYPLLESYVDARAGESDRERVVVGRFTARHIACRELSLAVADLVDHGVDPVAEAAMVKLVGTQLEQDVTDEIWQLCADRPFGTDGEPGADRLGRLLEINRLRSPVHTIAGGTSEIMRGLVARALPRWIEDNRAAITRRGPVAEVVTDLAAAVLAAASDHQYGPGEADPASLTAWRLLRENGFSVVGDPGAQDGFDDLLDVVRALAFAGLASPLVDGRLTAGLLLDRAGLAYDWDERTCVAVTGADIRASVEDGTATLEGTATQVAWVPVADDLAVLASAANGPVVAVVSADACAVSGRAADTAGEPVAGTVRFDGVVSRRVAPIAAADIAEARALRRVARVIAAGASMVRCADLALSHTTARRQFGRPLTRFQAVEALLAVIGCQAQVASLAAESAWSLLSSSDDDLRFVRSAAALVTGLDAAREVANAAHQVHGAMGITMEYELHRHTRRLWEFQRREGSADGWAQALGELVLTGRHSLWAAITDGSGRGRP